MKKLDTKNNEGNRRNSRRTYGLGWNGKLQDVYKWAAFGLLCAAWAVFIAVMFVGVTQHVVIATARGKFRVEDALMVIAAAIGPAVAHSFMIKHAVCIYKSYGHRVMEGPLMAYAPITGKDSIPFIRGDSVRNENVTSGSHDRTVNEDEGYTVPTKLAMGGGVTICSQNTPHNKQPTCKIKRAHSV